MTITKFVVHAGDIASQTKIVDGSLDETLYATARDAYARLLKGESDIHVTTPDGQQLTATVGIAFPPSADKFLAEHASEALKKASELGREAMTEMFRKSSFAVSTREATERYSLVRDAAPDPFVGAYIYGAVGGTRAVVEASKPESDRARFSLEVMSQLRNATIKIIASAPAMICSGRLHGDAAAFADCLAAVMLFDSGAAPEQTAVA